MSCSNRATSGDLLRARLSRTSTKDIATISCAWGGSQLDVMEWPLWRPDSARYSENKNAGNGDPLPAFAKRDCRSLEGEIKTAADHPEITVAGKGPAAIGDPTNVRRETNFQAPAHLADSVGIVVVIVVITMPTHELAEGSDKHKALVVVVAIAKDHATTGEEVRREMRAVEWIAQGKCS